ncbi:MAG: leucine-rich repeat domain-containing protein [Oscillatoriaceae cyanobacterium Prado104]|jgi:internalin A|nr:leucine-rich repeat domain-containing protein [Oscillatoriaceae cyanobacterium Prado104]
MSEQELGRSRKFYSFADWCKHKDSISEAAKRTVELLLNWTSTSDLDEVNRILSSRERLSLEEYQISDITPLQSLINLKYLDLHKNRISDITPLKSLINTLIDSKSNLDRKLDYFIGFWR